MKAYEFAGEVTTEGQLKLPEFALAQLAGHQAVRVIVLVHESSDEETQVEESWNSLTSEQFLAGYSSEDDVYDSL